MTAQEEKRARAKAMFSKHTQQESLPNFSLLSRNFTTSFENHIKDDCASTGASPLSRVDFMKERYGEEYNLEEIFRPDDAAEIERKRLQSLLNSDYAVYLMEFYWQRHNQTPISNQKPTKSTMQRKILPLRLLQRGRLRVYFRRLEKRLGLLRVPLMFFPSDYPMDEYAKLCIRYGRKGYRF